MFNPIGSFLVRMDQALAGSMDGIISGMTSAMAVPVAAAAIVYYAVQGLRFANGDPEPMHNFVPQLIRVGVVIWLSSNLGAFNQWVRDIFFTGLPNAIAFAIGNSTGATANSVSATAALFDAIWGQTWLVVGSVWGLVTFTTMGVMLGIAAIMAGIFGGLGLLVLAMVYICARLLLAVVICLAPILIGCAMFETTRPIFDRAVGTVVSLILMQLIGLIILQMILLGDQWFMAQAVTAFFNAMAAPSAMADEIQILIGLVVWFVAGAYAMYNVPTVAYSIGAGIMPRGPPLMLMAALASRLGGGGSGSVSPPPSSPPPALNVTPVGNAGGGHAAIPPSPPPPSIAGPR